MVPERAPQQGNIRQRRLPCRPKLVHLVPLRFALSEITPGVRNSGIA